MANGACDLGCEVAPSGLVSPGSLSSATAQAEEYPVSSYSSADGSLPSLCMGMICVHVSAKLCTGSQGTLLRIPASILGCLLGATCEAVPVLMYPFSCCHFVI